MDVDVPSLEMLKAGLDRAWSNPSVGEGVHADGKGARN